MVHARQRRKGTETPYIAHLLHVAALVIEDGSLAGELNEDEAIAALLHDAAEDQGGEERLADIRERFGEPGGRDRCRLQRHLRDPEAAVAGAQGGVHRSPADETDRGILRVSLADKVHNSRAILIDYRLLGEELWTRFNRDADTPWYYRTLAGVLDERMPDSFLADELRRNVAELDSAVGA